MSGWCQADTAQWHWVAHPGASKLAACGLPLGELKAGPFATPMQSSYNPLCPLCTRKVPT